GQHRQYPRHRPPPPGRQGSPNRLGEYRDAFVGHRSRSGNPANILSTFSTKRTVASSIWSRYRRPSSAVEPAGSPHTPERLAPGSVPRPEKKYPDTIAGVGSTRK